MIRIVRRYSNVAGHRPVPDSKGLPFLGTILSILAAGGAPKLHLYIDKRHREYGSIFREKLGPVSGVFISDGGYMRKVFAAEGKYPRHIIPESWAVYNQMHKCQRGLLFMDGEEWASFRKPLNNVLLKGHGSDFTKAASVVAKNMVDKWRKEEVVIGLEQQLYKWSLEVIVAILLGSETYKKCREDVQEDIEGLARVIHQIFVESAGLSLIPVKLAVRLRLPIWKRFEKAVASTSEAGQNLLKLLLQIRQENPRPTGLLHKIQDCGIQDRDLSRVVMDLVLAAGDTTSYTMQWILHLLSINQKTQSEIYEELKGLEEDEATSSPILKGVLKEALRLYPVAPFITRYLPEGVVIDGYQIQSGELVLMSLYSSGRDERYFRDASLFLPQRWVRTAKDYDSNLNANASLPFAIGSRSCIGRKIAETQILVTLLQILRTFRIESEDDKPIDIKLHLISVPERSISLRLKPRSSEAGQMQRIESDTPA